VKLEIAISIAAELVERLVPFCSERSGDFTSPQAGGVNPPLRAIAVAGSIRRRRPQVNDIDLVAIPRLARVKAGLFDEGPEDAEHSGLAVALCSLLGKQVHQRGPKNNAIPAAEFAAGIRVDLYLATVETWATTLLIRTGSKEHNIWLCQRARELGGKLHANGDGLELPGDYDAVKQCAGPSQRITSATEDKILAALCWSNVPPPERREILHGRPFWLPKHAHDPGYLAKSTGGAK
jgi:DNA polymerase/3'-5' exonuclease PolX